MLVCSTLSFCCLMMSLLLCKGKWPTGRRAQTISAGHHDHVSEKSLKGAAPTGTFLFYVVCMRLGGSLTRTTLELATHSAVYF